MVQNAGFALKNRQKGRSERLEVVAISLIFDLYFGSSVNILNFMRISHTTLRHSLNERRFLVIFMLLTSLGRGFHA